MTPLSLRFRCGHTARVDVDKTPTPICLECGDRNVAHVLHAPKPTFRGVASGPFAETQRLEAIPVSLAERHLVIKDTLGEKA